MRSMRSTSLAFIAICAAACHSGDDNSSSMMSSSGAQAPGRGSLTSAPTKVASLSTTDLIALLSGGTVGNALLQYVSNPTCGVDVYSIQYNTVGGANEATTASGAIMVPTGSDSQCQGGRAIVLYAHGTSTDKTYNVANIKSSSDFEGQLLATIFAAQGYIVVAPNYAGYDTSPLTYHPYLNGDQQSKDMIDALTAARTALPQATSAVTDGGKLYITGYSQGGYVAMATHRALQAAGVTVTASAPMSGPYSLAAFVDAIFEGQVDGGAPINATLLVSSYQHAYGNIYSTPTDVFEAKYATGIDTLLPSTSSRSDLYAQGKLPQNALFNSTPPAPEYAPITPATAPASLAPVFEQGFGPDNLITNAYRLAYLQDAQANPDGGFPNTTNDVPAANPANTLRKATKTNDLRNWTPSAPMFMCGGHNDPTVFYMNTQLMQGYLAANAPSAPVTVLDVDSAINPSETYADIKAGFAALQGAIEANAVAQGATDGGQQAVFEAYHATMVAPFCVIAARSFFRNY